MPMRIEESTPIPRFPHLSSGQRGDAINCIHKLKYSDVFRTAAKSEIARENQFRIDLQGVIPSSGGLPARQNIQVQIGSHTVAHADVAQSIMTDDEPNQRGALKKIKTTLRQSLTTGKTHLLRGTCP